MREDLEDDAAGEQARRRRVPYAGGCGAGAVRGLGGQFHGEGVAAAVPRPRLLAGQPRPRARLVLRPGAGELPQQRIAVGVDQLPGVAGPPGPQREPRSCREKGGHAHRRVHGDRLRGKTYRAGQ